MPFGNFTLLLSLEGGLWAFGCNFQGQLGLSHERNQLEPIEVPWNGPQPVQVDWGSHHSLVLDAEGGVWETGRSRDSPPSLTFCRVTELPLASLVVAGTSHSAAVDTEGGLWVWTSSSNLSWASFLPQQVKGLPPLIKLACGDSFIIAEAEEGSLWVLGDNAKGQLGLGHTNSAPHPTLIRVAERSEGPLRCLAAQAEGVIIIDSQGAVFSAGGNEFGQLGRPPGDPLKFQRIGNIPSMLQASCGYVHALSLDENGGVWGWGCSGRGRLGTGSTLNQSQPIQVTSLKNISALVAGGYHSFGFPQEGTLLAFGYNCYGQLGLNHTVNQTTPTLSPLRPALPYSARSKKKSARSLIVT